jgi:rSAM/selenodomain-associated transferase 1
MNRQQVPPVVALFVRIPVPGQVKTRLAADLGDQGACRLYEAMVRDIITNMEPAVFPLYLFHDGTEDRAVPAAWAQAAVGVTRQQGADIGARMAAAFAHCFARGLNQVVLVGSDIPEIDAALLRSASAALASHDVAIAPAVDGGYGLIAMQREQYQSRIFENIPWSTDQVLNRTLQRIAACGLTVNLLKPLQDIDTLDDLEAYRRKPCAQAVATNRAIAHLRGGIP